MIPYAMGGFVLGNQFNWYVDFLRRNLQFVINAIQVI